MINPRNVIGNGRIQRQSGKTAHGQVLIEDIFHGRITQLVPLLRTVNPQHGHQRRRTAAIARLGMVRFDDCYPADPRESALHPPGKLLLTRPSALMVELTIRKGQLMAHAYLPVIQQIFRYPLTTGACSYLP